jgi:hypothetical protein
MPLEQATTPQDAVPAPPLVPFSRGHRLVMSVAIVVFFSFHVWLSIRSALLQDDRYGWRMFHNVGFSKVDYRWITHEGKAKRYKPKRSSIVQRGHGLIIHGPGTWRTTLYSAGAVHETVKAYVKYMGETHRPKWAKAFEARIKLRINNEKKAKTYVYRYPEAE